MSYFKEHINHCLHSVAKGHLFPLSLLTELELLVTTMHTDRSYQERVQPRQNVYFKGNGGAACCVAHAHYTSAVTALFPWSSTFMIAER